MSQAGTKPREGRLPADLAAALEPGLRQCLESPARREILRIVNGADQALSVRSIATRLTAFTVSEVGYHVRVLERAGGLKASDGPAQATKQHHGYVSGVHENIEALSALRATQQWDVDNRRTRRRPASLVPKMFRIPRPTETIRLGKPDRGES